MLSPVRSVKVSTVTLIVGRNKEGANLYWEVVIEGDYYEYASAIIYIDANTGDVGSVNKDYLHRE